MTIQKETTFSIDRNKLKAKEEKVKFGVFSAILIILNSVLYYYIIGADNFPIFILMTIFVCGLIIYSIYSGLKNARRMWESFYIKLNEEDIEFCFDKPIHNEFEKTKWKRENQSMSWKNIKLKTGNKIVLIDNTKSIFNRVLFGKGARVIPKEIENYEKLVSVIKKKITIDKK